MQILEFLEQEFCSFYNDLSRFRFIFYFFKETIMIAESKSEEKDTMVKLVVNLINSNN